MSDDSAARILDRQARLEQVLADYLHSVEQGQPLDRSALIAAHPDLADDLQSFFRNRDSMDRLAEPLKAAADAPTLLGVSEIGRSPAGMTVRYFGDYELLEEIARGGMGVVYKARQVNLNRIVALKMILAGQLANDSDVKRFYAEAEAAAKLDHPGIVPIFEIGQHDGQHYFSMAFIEGVSLAKKVAAGPLPPREAAALVKTIAQAVEYAHQKGIIHRDLKPANVLLDQTGQPRVTDFGLAKQLQGDSGLTGTGQILGTPSYMPPEQAAGKVDQVGSQSDVYALGAILYCLLTGRPPFQAANPMDTLLQVLEQEPVAPRQINMSVPRDLETITLKCLQKEPRRRYTTAHELSDELERFLAGQPIKARPSTVFERTVKWARRRPAVAGLFAVTAAAAMILVVGWLWFTVQLRHERDYSQQQELLAKNRLWLSLYEQARAERLVGNRPRALEIIAEAARTRRTPELRQEAIESITLPGVQLRHEIPFGHACTVKFSPDGSRLAVHGKYGYGPGRSSEDPPENDVSMLIDWELPSGRLVSHRQLPLSAVNLTLGLSGLSPSSISQYAPFALSPRTGWAAISLQADDKIQFCDLALGNVAATIDAWARGPVVFNGDGTLAAAMKNGTDTQVWNIDHGQPEGVPVAGQPVTFVSEDELLVMDNRSACLRRVNFRTGQVVFSTPEQLPPMAVSQNGRTAALSRGGYEASVPLAIWDLPAGRELITLPLVGRGTSRQPYEVQFSPDGRMLAFHQTSEPNSIKIWDRSTNTIKASFPGVVYGEGNLNQYQTAAFSPNGRLLVTYVRTKSDVLQIWDVENQRSSGILRENHSPLWSPDGRWLATIGPGQATRPDGTKYGQDRTFVRIWEATYPTPLAALLSPIDTLNFDHQGRQLAVNDTLYDVLSTSTLPELRASPQKAVGELIVFDRAGRMEAVDFPTGSLAPKDFAVRHSTPEKQDVFLSPPEVPASHRRAELELASLTADRKLVGWDPAGKWLAMFCRTWWKKTGTDGRNTQNSNGEGCLAVWDLAADQKTPVWQDCLEGPIYCVAITPAGDRLAMGDKRGVRLWKLTSGKRLQRFECAKKWTSPEKLEELEGRGWTKMSGSGNGPYDYTKHFVVHDIRFSSDGSRLYAAAEGGRIYVADVATGRELAVWEGHHAGALALAIHPDEKILASGGEDRMIRLWDISSGQELAGWEAHRADVTALSFNGDGCWLASGSADGTVKLWNMPWIRQELLNLGFQ